MQDRQRLPPENPRALSDPQQPAGWIRTLTCSTETTFYVLAVYFGSIGGTAALLAEEHIRKVSCIDYPELGMEAVWKIEVVDFPAFILVDDKGNDFFARLGC